jgi:branched-chain amino acid transport system ATP-binding protein
VLTIEALNTWYGAAHILHDLTFEIGDGEVVTLLGPNGAGKSTTMKAVMGLVERRGGMVRFNGEDISRLQPFQIAKRGIGFTPEDRRIFTELTVMENLDIGRQSPRNFPNGSQAPIWTPQRLFTLFPNLSEMPHRLAGNISGGEQQMLTVARTLMGNPLLILLDEPSEGVAPLVMEQMADIIIELKKKGISVLLSEQNLYFANAITDRAYVLESGRICWQGSMAELNREREVQRTYLAM